MPGDVICFMNGKVVGSRCPMGLLNCNIKSPEDIHECGCYPERGSDDEWGTRYVFASCYSESGCVFCKAERSCEDVFSRRIGF